MSTGRFTAVNRDKNFNTVKTTTVNKVPRVVSLASIGGSTGPPERWNCEFVPANKARRYRI